MPPGPPVLALLPPLPPLSVGPPGTSCIPSYSILASTSSELWLPQPALSVFFGPQFYPQFYPQFLLLWIATVEDYLVLKS